MSSVNTIASLATQQSQARTQQNVGIAVAKKSLDAARQQGDAVVSLLESAAQVQDQANAAAQSGIPGSLDIQA